MNTTVSVDDAVAAARSMTSSIMEDGSPVQSKNALTHATTRSFNSHDSHANNSRQLLRMGARSSALSTNGARPAKNVNIQSASQNKMEECFIAIHFDSIAANTDH